MIGVLSPDSVRRAYDEVAPTYAAQFPPIKTFTVDEVFGGANKAFATHFKDGGSFDQIYVAK